MTKPTSNATNASQIPMGVTGTVLIDDVNLELVPASTPLSNTVQ